MLVREGRWVVSRVGMEDAKLGRGGLFIVMKGREKSRANQSPVAPSLLQFLTGRLSSGRVLGNGGG